MPKHHLLNFLSAAPDLALSDLNNQPVKLSFHWKQSPLLLSFTRHFGCTQCKEMLSQLVEHKEKIKQAGLSIVVVTQGTPQLTRLYMEQYGPGLTVLCDPERKAYRAYGLERANIFQSFLNTRVWKAIRNARKKGFMVETPPEGQDAMQMSGTFIINREGIILLPYYYEDIADHPSVDLLLEGVLSTDWQQPFSGPIGPEVKK